MNIIFDRECGVFKLDTPNTSYVLALADGKWLGHVYYGRRLDTTDLGWALGLELPPYTPGRFPRDALSFTDCFPMEYPVANIGDFREHCLAVRTAAGQLDCLPLFESYAITPGKPALGDLPATFGDEDSCATLTLTLRDKAAGVKVELSYTAFTQVDAITRSVRVTCEGEEAVTVERALSACVDLPYEPGMECLTLHGTWARERHIQRQGIGIGCHSTGSKRGISSHQEHPFLAVLDPGTDQDKGRVWAMNFVYSGNFLAQVERNQFDRLRLVMGIHPEGFSWRLGPGESFQTPETVLVYSDSGLGTMTRTFHDLYRSHLIRSKWQYAPRPVLVNNWEATYYDFDEDKLLEIARRSAQLGIELFVLDDGWFGERNTDSGYMGDWQVNRRKLPGGLNALADKIEALGMKFGLWMEPEMVTEDAEVYKAHPDWAIRTACRAPGRARDQLVLDLSRPEVEEYVYAQIHRILSGARISYLKWDMNRPLADLGSAALPPERQGEVSHRYMLAVYRLQERMLRDFPELLLENCCSGGGRYDPGMLYYSPQIWCSDNNDAIERLSIQEGTALIYPLSTIGAHVAACPSHNVRRVAPFETRAAVASMGTFGYELDVTALSEAEQAAIPGQVAGYKRQQALIQSGDYYRLSSAIQTGLDAQLVIAKDKGMALLTVVRVLAQANVRRKNLPLRGLEPTALYRIEGTQKTYSGQALMAIGLPVDLPEGDFTSAQLWLERVK